MHEMCIRDRYIPSTDTFIEKDSSVNDEIDRMRHSATAWLAERRDVVIVASVSCIYGLGDTEEYESLSVSLREGMEIDRDELLRRLVEIQYERNDFEQERGSFRAVSYTHLDVYKRQAWYRRA